MASMSNKSNQMNRDDLIRDLYKNVVGQEIYRTTEDDKRYHADTNSLHNTINLDTSYHSRRFEIMLENAEYTAISMGNKNFFLTKDVNYLIGDVLAFREVNNLQLTGSASLRTVAGIEKNVPGLETGYCILWWK